MTNWPDIAHYEKPPPRVTERGPFTASEPGVYPGIYAPFGRIVRLTVSSSGYSEPLQMKESVFPGPEIAGE